MKQKEREAFIEITEKKKPICWGVISSEDVNVFFTVQTTENQEEYLGTLLYKYPQEKRKSCQRFGLKIEKGDLKLFWKKVNETFRGIAMITARMYGETIAEFFDFRMKTLEDIYDFMQGSPDLFDCTGVIRNANEQG